MMAISIKTEFLPYLIKYFNGLMINQILNIFGEREYSIVGSKPGLQSQTAMGSNNLFSF